MRMSPKVNRSHQDYYDNFMTMLQPDDDSPVIVARRRNGTETETARANHAETVLIACINYENLSIIMIFYIPQMLK